MGNRPTTAVATIAAIGTAGYFVYRNYTADNNNNNNNRNSENNISNNEEFEIENEEGDDSIRDIDEIRQGSGTMELQQVNTSTMQQRTLIQILCVAILTVLAIITLIVSLLRQEMPTDLPLFVPLFWTTIGIGIATTGAQQRQTNKSNMKIENNNDFDNNDDDDFNPLSESGPEEAPADDERKVDDDDDDDDDNIISIDENNSNNNNNNNNLQQWSPSDEIFQIRGKHYLDKQHVDYKVKVSSSPSLYEPLYLTVRRTNAGETIDIHNIEGLPESVINEQNKVNSDNNDNDDADEFKGMTSTLPNILLLHQILPVEQPSVWSTTTKENSPSIHLLVYFKLTDQTKQHILSNNDNNISSLLKTWIQPHDPLYDHWKTIIKLRNPETVDIGMVGNQLIRQYNGKPFLSYGSAQRDVYPNDKIVVTVDVYKFSYAMRNFYYSILQTDDESVLNNAVIDMAFFIEGRVPEHLPESILGSFTIKDLRILQEN